MNKKQDNWREVTLPISSTLKQVIQNMNESGKRFVLFMDRENYFQGTVSDGDIRRGILHGLDLEAAILPMVNRKPQIAPSQTSDSMVLEIMEAKKITYIPLTDANGKLTGLKTWDTLNHINEKKNVMVIMAGGRGVRMQHHTKSCPKPMLTVGDKPMLEHIIDRAKLQGFLRFIISVNYLGNMIKEYFGNGSSKGVEISYLEETKSLGTVGALSLIDPRPTERFILTNGDVLTDINYSGLIDFGATNDAHGVMAVRAFEMHNPYGEVKVEGINITGFTEKPVIRSSINAGIYAFAPKALEYLDFNQFCDIPEFFERLRTARLRTIAYGIHEEWMDVGSPLDLQEASLNNRKKQKARVAK
jgi:dTDP-glucose pyrophosphorylase